MKRASLLLLMLGLFSCEEQAPRSADVPTAQVMPTQLRPDSPEFSGENAYVHCAAICNLGPRFSGSPAYAAMLDYLTGQLELHGWTVKRESFKIANGMTMTNLHAFYGDTTATRPILVSCHVDTKVGIAPDFVSADDGATAPGVMVELARMLAKDPDKAGAVELVFFDGEESFALHMTEEDGLYGSRYDAERRGVELPDYMINLDMVGGRNKVIAIPSVETSQEMYAHYVQARQALGFSSARWTVHMGSILDDNRPFEDVGVKTLNLIADFTRSSWWHTPRDNMQRICPVSLKETGQMTMQLIKQLRESNQGL